MLNKFNNLHVIVSEFLIDEVWETALENTLKWNHGIKKIDTLSWVFARLIASAKNRSMLKNVLPWPYADERFDRLMFNYDYKKVRIHYTSHSLLNAFKEVFTEKKILKLWEWFSFSIIDISTRLHKFTDYSDFEQFVLSYKNQPEVVPMLIEKEIRWIWFALACDFLKELGFDYYAKPDVHIKDILVWIGVSNNSDTDLKIFKDMIELAKINNITPFLLDKELWLIGSGDFEWVKVKKNRKESFIEYYNRFFN